MNIITEFAPPRAGRQQGAITARLDGISCGSLTFGLGPGRQVVRSTNYDVPRWAQRRGVGLALCQALFDAFPNHEVAEGGGSNSQDGDSFLAAVRERGFPYHAWECFLEDDACTCPLSGRRRS